MFQAKARPSESASPPAEIPSEEPAADEEAARSIAELLEGVADRHPAELMMLAASLMKVGRRDEAVFWFYAGQLRYRYYYAANHQKLEGSQDASLVSALLQSVGQAVNVYAFADLPKLRDTIDEVIRWDEATPNGFFSKESDLEARREVIAGLLQLRQTTIDNAAEIQAQRASNGLPNF